MGLVFGGIKMYINKPDCDRQAPDGPNERRGSYHAPGHGVGHAVHNQRNLAAQQSGSQGNALYILMTASFVINLPAERHDNHQDCQPGDQARDTQIDSNL
jgi:hypothetical protein